MIIATYRPTGIPDVGERAIECRECSYSLSLSTTRFGSDFLWETLNHYEIHHSDLYTMVILAGHFEIETVATITRFTVTGNIINRTGWRRKEATHDSV